MTIDEAITHAREKAKEQKSKYDKCPTRMKYACEMCFHEPKCNEIAEECEHLAEWLEELKDLREMKETITSNAEVLVRQGYNSAIDDFQDKLHRECHAVNYDDYGIYSEEINEIAEQLRQEEIRNR